MAAEPSDWLQNFGIAIEIFFPTLALIVTILRVYTRLKIKSYGWGMLRSILRTMVQVVLRRERMNLSPPKHVEHKANKLNLR